MSDYAYLGALSGDIFFRRFRILQHRHRPAAPAYNPLHLRMPWVADNDNLLSRLTLPADNFVDALHKGAGGVYALQAALLQNAVDFLRHAVGADDYAARRETLQLLLRLQDPDALLRKLSDHFLIVHDRTIGIYSFSSFYLFIHGIHRTFHAKTETGAFRKPYFHVCLFFILPFFKDASCRQPNRSLQSPMIREITWSTLMSEVSTRTASSACFKGDISLCISL